MKINQNLLIFLFLMIGFLLTITIHIYQTDRYWENQTQLKNYHEIELIVTKMRYTKGTLSFNDEVYLKGYELKKGPITLDEISDLKTPFELKKRNDSIFIQKKNISYLLIIKTE